MVVLVVSITAVAKAYMWASKMLVYFVVVLSLKRRRQHQLLVFPYYETSLHELSDAG